MVIKIKLVKFCSLFFVGFFQYISINTTWRSNRHLTNTWQTPDRHLRDTWQTLDGHLTNTWQTPYRHLTNTWQTLDKYLTDKLTTRWQTIEYFWTRYTYQMTIDFLSFKLASNSYTTCNRRNKKRSTLLLPLYVTKCTSRVTA